MRGAKTRTWPDDTTQIKLEKQEDLTFWAGWFHVSQEVLRRAVATVGPRVSDVSARLRAQRHGTA
jgi:hypothetical protein